MKLQMHKTCSAVMALMLATLLPAAVYASNIGPYKLGMTNAEAAKIGIHECEEARHPETGEATLRCKGVQEGGPQVFAPTVIFSKKSKRVVLMSSGSIYGQNELGAIMRTLKLAACPSELAEDDNTLFTCHFPDGIRHISWQSSADRGGLPALWTVMVASQPGEARKFLATKEKARKKADEMSRFQRGG